MEHGDRSRARTPFAGARAGLCNRQRILDSGDDALWLGTDPFIQQCAGSNADIRNQLLGHDEFIGLQPVVA